MRVEFATTLLLVLLGVSSTIGQAAEGNYVSDEVQVQQLIEGLYGTVSFDAGQVPAWDRARSFFLPEAVVVFAPRTEGSAQVMDLEGWVQDFISFYEDRHLETRGFRETIAGMEVTVYGNIAHAFVVFEPRVGPDWDAPSVPGVDAINLVKHDGRWWIASITTQFSSDTHPIPQRFLVR
jgi:hypothetical protein